MQAAFVKVRDEAEITDITTIEQFTLLFEQAVAIAVLNTTDDIGAAFERYGKCLSLTFSEDYSNAKTAVDTAFSYVRNELKPDNIAKVQKAYRTVLAIGMINSVARDKIDSVLTAYNDVLKLDLSGDYKKVDKIEVGKALTHKDFTSLSAVQTAFEKCIEDLTSPSKESSGSSGGGGGGSSSGGRVTESVSIVGDIEQVPPSAVEQNITAFTDINEVGEWAHESIYNLAESGIINGVGDGKFEPNTYVTREQFVKMLVLAFEMSTEGAEANYGDVGDKDWFYPYVAAASNSGIVQGIADGKFGVGLNITRQDMTVMACRALSSAGVMLESADLTFDFDDSGQIADYAVESVSAMVKSGIINGIGNNLFAPDDFTTRAQAAKVINELLKLN